MRLWVSSGWGGLLRVEEGSGGRGGWPLRPAYRGEPAVGRHRAALSEAGFGGGVSGRLDLAGGGGGVAVRGGRPLWPARRDEPATAGTVSAAAGGQGLLEVVGTWVWRGARAERAVPGVR